MESSLCFLWYIIIWHSFLQSILSSNPIISFYMIYIYFEKKGITKSQKQEDR